MQVFGSLYNVGPLRRLCFGYMRFARASLLRKELLHCIALS